MKYPTEFAWACWKYKNTNQNLYYDSSWSSEEIQRNLNVTQPYEPCIWAEGLKDALVLKVIAS